MGSGGSSGPSGSSSSGWGHHFKGPVLENVHARLCWISGHFPTDDAGIKLIWRPWRISGFRVPGSRFHVRFRVQRSAFRVQEVQGSKIRQGQQAGVSQAPGSAGSIGVSGLVLEADWPVILRARGTLEPGTQNLERGTRNPERGTRNPERGTRNLEPGTWNLEPGTWNLEPGTWNLEPPEGRHTGGVLVTGKP
jgi:hypothetical protein